jgi:hypothetical protein
MKYIPYLVGDNGKLSVTEQVGQLSDQALMSEIDVVGQAEQSVNLYDYSKGKHVDRRLIWKKNVPFYAELKCLSKGYGQSVKYLDMVNGNKISGALVNFFSVVVPLMEKGVIKGYWKYVNSGNNLKVKFVGEEDASL